MNQHLAILSAAIVTASAMSAGAITPSERVFFENKIRPILVNHCYECHTPDAKKLGGNLLLDSRKNLIKGGESGSPIVIGKPNESLLIHSLRWEDDLEMPPKKPLPPNVVADFVR